MRRKRNTPVGRGYKNNSKVRRSTSPPLSSPSDTRLFPTTKHATEWSATEESYHQRQSLSHQGPRYDPCSTLLSTRHAPPKSLLHTLVVRSNCVDGPRLIPAINASFETREIQQHRFDRWLVHVGYRPLRQQLVPFLSPRGEKSWKLFFTFTRTRYA